MNRTKKYCLLLVVWLVWAAGLSAQAPDTDWAKTYGGSNAEEIYSVDATGDGYIITGYTTSFGGGNADMYILKTDLNGDSLWMTVWGTSRQERGRDVIAYSGGGYAMVGIERLMQNSFPQIVFHKLNAAGAIVNTKNYGHVGEDRSWSIIETSDNGFAIAGYTDVSNSGQTDVYLIRTDANGDTVWTRNYGGIDDDEGYRAEQTLDGGFIITGGTSSFSGDGNWDVYLIRTTANGDTLWTRTYGGTNFETGYCVRQTSDGGFIVSGRTESYGAGESDCYLIKTAANGDTLWTKTYGGHLDDFAQSVIEINNGYTIIGHSQSFGDVDRDMYIVRTNLFGDTLWTKVIGGDGEDWGYDVVPTGDGGYAATGYTNSWGAGYFDAWLVKLDFDATGVGKHTPRSPLFVTSHPNPFNPITTITYRLPTESRVTLCVYDATGKRLETLIDGVRPAGKRSISWNATGYPSGVYFLQLDALGETRVVKAVLLK